MNKKSSNPFFSKVDNNQQQVGIGTDVATRFGIITKTLLALLIFTVTLVISMQTPAIMAVTSSWLFFITAMIAIFVCAIRMAKNVKAAKFFVFFYAILEGLLVSSWVYMANYYSETNVGIQAAVIVLVIFFLMLFIYASFPSFVAKATPIIGMLTVAVIGMMITYMLYALIFGSAFGFDSNANLIITIIIVVLASFNYLRDFKMTDYIVTNNMPKEYEYLAAAGLITTTVWLFIEVVKLLTIFNRR